MHTDSVPADLLKLLAAEVLGLEAAVSRLEEVRNRLPLPSPAALAAMRAGRRPISQPVFLAGVLQEGIVGVDDSASNLGCEIKNPRRDALWHELSAIETNSIENALHLITAAAGDRRKGKA